MHDTQTFIAVIITISLICITRNGAFTNIVMNKYTWTIKYQHVECYTL